VECLMDIGKILEIGKSYIGDYVNMILNVFTNPRFLHEETVKNYGEETPSSTIIVPSQVNFSKGLKKFPSQVIVNVFISIFIGSFLHKLNPSSNASADLAGWIILVILFWVMYLLVVFALFKLLKGKLDLLNFLAVCLQIIASAYIISRKLPMIVYISIQSLLLVIYTPISLSEFIS
jgi:hypothetical protein